MKAVIVSVGTELTSGQTVDTNSAFLSRQLAMHGIATVQHITVGDDQAAIASAIKLAASMGELVIVTGGLGPTEDDLTRAGLAAALGCPLVLDEACLKDIEEFFRQRNRTMHAINRVQAMVPALAKPIINRVGTAPGIVARIGQAQVFVTPGVPSEMEWMFHNAIAPLLPQQEGVILHRVVHTFGAGESDVGVRIADLMKRGANPLIGTTVAAGMVSIRILSHGQTADVAKAQADQAVETLRERLGELIIGADADNLPSAVRQVLLRRGATVSTAESCTGGLIGKMLTDVPGSSDCYVGGVIAYSNRLKTQLLGVPADMLEAHGAVSEPVAAAMAQSCRERLGSDWAISVTGIAGPTGGTPTKPVGLVYIGLAGPTGTEVYRQMFPSTREIVRMRTALAAMNYLRLKLVPGKQ